MNNLFGQINEIKSNCQELCFNIPIKAKKFDVRTKIHSDNTFSRISDYKNYDDTYVIGASFAQNLKLSYGKYSYSRDIYYYFQPNSERSYSTKIALTFKTENLKKCIDQYNELKNIFKNISYSSFSSDVLREGEKTGESTLFYSSHTAKNVRLTESNEFSTYYISFSYRFISVKVGYQLEIYIRQNNIY